jgi:exodeoxyribonuclease V gamma subunit
MKTSSHHGFMVLHSNQLEGLRDLMVNFIQRHPLSPLQPEVILVQSNGMKHWLEISLAQSLGICAATEIELPSTLLWQFYRHVLGAERVNALMPLDKKPMVWRLMRRLPHLLAQPEFSTLERYVQEQDDAGTTRNRRIFQLAQQIADVFDGYQNYRADWLQNWAKGDFAELDESQRWQGLLWQDIAQDLLNDELTTDLHSRAAVHQAFLEALQQYKNGERPHDLPERIMIFGITSLPTQTIEALAALGRVSQVMLWVQNPCEHHWGHLVESHRPLRQAARRRQKLKQNLPIPNEHLSLHEQYQLHTQGNPLLAAWGKQGRDYLHLLD